MSLKLDELMIVEINGQWYVSEVGSVRALDLYDD